jgi:hypothetical protein
MPKLFGISLKVTGLDDMIRRMGRLDRNLQREMVVATREAGLLILKEMRAVFLRQGPNWPQLSPSYLRWKMRGGWDTRILYRTGRLFNALRFRRDGVGAGFVGVDSPERYPNLWSVRALWRGKRRTIPPGKAYNPTVVQVASYHENPSSRNRGIKRDFAWRTREKAKKILRRSFSEALKRALAA